MTIKNPEIDYAKTSIELRSVYVQSPPRHRLNIIKKRLKHPEIGAARLITMVSAVEALARSLLVHANAKNTSKPEESYEIYRRQMPRELVENLFALYQQEPANKYFKEDSWKLFLQAIDFRNLVIHECTFLGQDKYPSLIQATEEVLEALINLGGLDWKPGSGLSRVQTSRKC